MRVLLTGATGFLGSHLAHAFVKAGHDVAAVLRPTSNLRRLVPIQSSLTVVEISSVEQSLPAFRPEAVVHTATCYGRAGESFSELMEANVVFPSRLAKLAVDAQASLFINTDTTLPPELNDYALSKSRFVQAIKPLANAGTRFANVRLEYVFGPGDDDTKFPAHVIRACVRQVPELKLTPGEQMRDFIYIDDVVAAYLILLDEAPGQPAHWQDYGLGTGVPTTIRVFAETAKRENGSSTMLYFGALPYRTGEPKCLCADVKALERLGWHPRVALVDGIRKVIEHERSSCGC